VSKIFKISINSLKKVDSILVFPGASNINITLDTIFLVSTGIFNQTPSRIYKIEAVNFRKIDSITISKNIFSFAMNNDYLVLGSWDGFIYILNHQLKILDSLKISSSINFIYAFENEFYISSNGFSYNPNYLMILKFNPFKIDSFKFSDQDVGIGPLFTNYIQK
jgi:WD40 repeat protein